MEPPLTLTCSPGLPRLLTALRISLAFTTYRAGKLFLVGTGEGGRLAVCERTFDRAMGLFVEPGARAVWLATRMHVHRLADALRTDADRRRAGADRLFVPRVSWTTGELDVHDLLCEADGRVVFAATRMNVLGTLSDGASLEVVWKPPFVSALVPEDRCHLNGIALREGRARYVTLIARTDVADGWRDRRADGGVVMDVASDSVVAEGLSMPHSPRLFRGRLWLLESGSGHLGFLDATGRFERLLFLPGYARGLAFAGRFAFVGLSLPREDPAFADLPLQGELERRGAEPRCGVVAVDVESGTITEWLRLEGVVRELYDVAVLPGVVRPKLLGLSGEELARTITVAGPARAAVPRGPRPRCAGSLR